MEKTHQNKFLWTRVSLLSIFLFLSFSTTTYSQQPQPLHALWFGGGFDIGVPFTQYKESRNILKARFPAYQINGRLSVRYIFLDRVGMELGVVQHYQHVTMTDKDFVSRYSDFKLKIKNDFFYPGVNASIFYRQPVQPGIYVYGLVGYSLNFIGQQELSETKNFLKGNEDISMTSTYASQNNSLLCELGIQNELQDRHMLSYALQFNNGQGNMVEGKYQIAQNGTVLTQDAYTSQGTYMAFSIKYHYLLAKKDKKENSYVDPLLAKPSQINKPTGKLEQPVELPETLNGRKMVVTHRLVVTKPNVTIKIWDHEEVDGDIVSLNLNNSWLIQYYTLVKEPKVIQASLHFGANRLVSYAINLGKYKPNTAAISVFDGGKEQRVILESDMNTSSVIEILYNGQ